MSSELVIGIVRTVGTDFEKVMDYMRNALREFDYEIELIKVSKTILEGFSSKGYDSFDSIYDRTNYFMDLGDYIRDKTQPSILAKGVAAYIFSRFRGDEPKPLRRVAYIIDSIKHPEELAFLRNLYGDGFHLVGISSSSENRIRYLERKGMDTESAKRIVKRDDNEERENGQHTRDVFQESDYFMNADECDSLIRASVYRLLDLLFGNAFITPTFQEFAMFRAYVASLRSADLSRQVGAVITQHDEVLAEGVNDCPRAGGGMYWPRFLSEERGYGDIEGGRDHTIGFDSNRRMQEKLSKDILKALHLPESDENIQKIRTAGVGHLTEYGRVVHAEMEALLMCARNGVKTVGCDMFVTTFPCHNCAKHIIDAGIRHVYYIEPYPKSQALAMYDLEISDKEEPSGPLGAAEARKVCFAPFYGVGPHRFIDLFSMRSSRWKTRRRKDASGNKLKWERKGANLRNPMRPLTYLDAEKIAYTEYTDSIESLGEVRE